MTGGETIGDRRLIRAVQEVRAAYGGAGVETRKRMAEELRRAADRMEPMPDRWI